MEIAQAELELAVQHLKQVEDRIAIQRKKIDLQRSRGDAPTVEEEQLASLLRALHILKIHLGNVIDPIENDAGSRVQTSLNV